VKRKIKIIVLVAVALFAVWNLVSFFLGRTSTEIVRYGVQEEAFSTTLYLFKDEVVIESKQNGVLQPITADGARVHKGARVGALLSADTHEGALHEFLQIQDRVQRLQLYEGKETYAETLRTDGEITAISAKITKAAEKGDMEKLAALKEDLLVAKDEKSAAEGQKDTLIRLLEERQAALEQKIGNSIEEVFSPRAGIFFQGTDGLENIMKTEATDTLSPEELERLEDRIGTSGGGCKIVYNNEWRGVCTIDAFMAEKLKPGQAVSLQFRECGGESCRAKVKAVSEAENGKCMVVFYSDKSPQRLLKYRSVTADVIVSRHEGLRVPTKAIVEEDGKQGVYVQTVTDRVFKTVEVAHQGENYTIIREGENTALRLYDTVIY